MPLITIYHIFFCRLPFSEWNISESQYLTRLGRKMQSEGCFATMLINVLPCVTDLIRTHKEGGFE
ncbi:hypothetical protein T08_10591 [Trichinella sp. T8]|nr:hypothetical protein T08_10591 [Trichinella sp. T8]